MGIRQRKEVAGQPWVYDYKDPATGKRKLATPKSGLKRDAQALKKKIDAEIESGIHVPLSDSATFEAVARLYLQDNEQRHRDGRISFNYEFSQRKVIEKHLLPTLGHKRLAEITLEDGLDLYRKMVASGHAATNARDNLRKISRMERFAFRRGLTKKAVFKAAMAELSGLPVRSIKTFTLDDVRKLLAASAVQRRTKTAPQTLRNQAMLHLAVNLAAFCGLRWGEVFGLTLKAVDLEDNVLRIRRSLHRISDSGRFELASTTKTPAGQRDIPMPRHVRELLQEWLGSHYHRNADEMVFTLSSNSRPGKGGLCKGERAGQPICSSNFHHHWRGLLLHAGLRTTREKTSGYHFHALRHFASALMVEHHIPLTDVAGLMGHKSYDLTLQVYAHSIVGGAKRHAAFENMFQTVDATAAQLPPITP